MKRPSPFKRPISAPELRVGRMVWGFLLRRFWWEDWNGRNWHPGLRTMLCHVCPSWSVCGRCPLPVIAFCRLVVGLGGCSQGQENPFWQRVCRTWNVGGRRGSMGAVDVGQGHTSRLGSMGQPVGSCQEWVSECSAKRGKCKAAEVPLLSSLSFPPQSHRKATC